MDKLFAISEQEEAKVIGVVSAVMALTALYIEQILFRP